MRHLQLLPLLFLFLCQSINAQDTKQTDEDEKNLQIVEMADKELKESIAKTKDSLLCYDGYFRVLDEEMSSVYAAVHKKLSPAKQEELDKSQGVWQQNKYIVYSKNYMDFKKKFPDGNASNPLPHQRSQLMKGYRTSALHARKRMVYLLSLIGRKPE